MSELSKNVEAYQGTKHAENAALLFNAMLLAEKKATEIADLMHPTCSRIDPTKIRSLALVIVTACEYAMDMIDEHD